MQQLTDDLQERQACAAQPLLVRNPVVAPTAAPEETNGLHAKAGMQSSLVYVDLMHCPKHICHCYLHWLAAACCVQQSCMAMVTPSSCICLSSSCRAHFRHCSLQPAATFELHANSATPHLASITHHLCRANNHAVQSCILQKLTSCVP